jgi:hypothetical protein
MKSAARSTRATESSLEAQKAGDLAPSST